MKPFVKHSIAITDLLNTTSRQNARVFLNYAQRYIATLHPRVVSPPRAV
jgi:hypothetical protein